jgi:hypothetical protein
MVAYVELEQGRVDCLVGEQFNNRLWRQILTEVCREVESAPHELEIISPFGFELLGNKQFLQKKLRRFYCYIGISPEKSYDKNAILPAFTQRLLYKLRQLESSMLDDVVLLIQHDEIKKLRAENYLCQPSDKLIDLQLRATDANILTDYAHYVITTLDGLYAEKGEASVCHKNKVNRCRMYQLYVMQEQLFGHLLPPMDEEQCELYRLLFCLIDNMVQFFFTPELINTPLTDQELKVIEQLIKKRVALIKQAIDNTDYQEKVTIRSLSYHIEEPLELTLARPLYEQALQKISSTYLNFV